MCLVKEKSILITRISSVSSNTKTIKVLNSFIKFSGNAKGPTLQVTKSLEEVVYGFKTSKEVLRNAIA